MTSNEITAQPDKLQICSNNHRCQEHDIERGVFVRKERIRYTKIFYYQDQCRRCGKIMRSYTTED